MENIAQWVGIDVSKATLDVYIRPMGKAFSVANTEVEISHLVFVPLFIWVLWLLCVIIP